MSERDPERGDEERLCERCGATFWFRAGERRFFAKRGLVDPPRRCTPCRRARKAAARRGPTARPDPISSGPRDSVQPSDAALPRGTPLCALCGAAARVPFHVAVHRPVACEACYRWRLGVRSSLTEPR
jgi:CxxC-x17-CxxC domain-containing protein